MPTIPGRTLATLVGVDLLARASYGLARTPVLPLYAASLGAGPALVGAIGAASTVTGIVLKSPVGALSDVIGRKRLVLVGLVVFASGPFLYLAVPAVAALVVIRLVHGLATAVYSPVSMALVAALAKDRRGEWLSWLSNAKTVGSLAGAFLGGVLLSLGVAGAAAAAAGTGGSDLAPAAQSFRAAWLVAGGLGAAALVAGFLALRRVAPDEAPAGPRKALFAKLVGGMREVASDGQVLLASSCESVQNMTVGMMEQFLPLYVVLVAGRTPFEAGILFGVQTVSTLATKPLFGRLSDRRGRRGLVVAGMIACALPFAAIPWATDLPTLLGLAAVFGLGEALVTAASSALVADLTKERSLGAAMGVFGTIGDTGHALGPVLGGAILAAMGVAAVAPDAAPAFRVAFAAIAAALIVMTVIFVAGGRGRQAGGLRLEA